VTSFQRQLNLYGFRRITKGDDFGAYFHPHFIRGRDDLVQHIRRFPANKTPLMHPSEGTVSQRHQALPSSSSSSSSSSTRSSSSAAAAAYASSLSAPSSSSVSAAAAAAAASTSAPTTRGPVHLGLRPNTRKFGYHVPVEETTAPEPPRKAARMYAPADRLTAQLPILDPAQMPAALHAAAAQVAAQTRAATASSAQAQAQAMAAQVRAQAAAAAATAAGVPADGSTAPVVIPSMSSLTKRFGFAKILAEQQLGLAPGSNAALYANNGNRHSIDDFRAILQSVDGSTVIQAMQTADRDVPEDQNVDHTSNGDQPSSSSSSSSAATSSTSVPVAPKEEPEGAVVLIPVPLTATAVDRKSGIHDTGHHGTAHEETAATMSASNSFTGSGTGRSSSSSSDTDTEAFADEFGIFEELMVDGRESRNTNDGVSLA